MEDNWVSFQFMFGQCAANISRIEVLKLQKEQLVVDITKDRDLSTSRVFLGVIKITFLLK